MDYCAHKSNLDVCFVVAANNFGEREILSLQA